MKEFLKISPSTILSIEDIVLVEKWQEYGDGRYRITYTTKCGCKRTVEFDKGEEGKQKRNREFEEIEKLLCIEKNKCNNKNIKNNEKEGINMNKGLKGMFKNVFGKVGKVEGLALTLDGQVSIERKNGDYVRYNKKDEVIENQMSMVIKQTADMMYAIPTQEVVVGDILLNKDKYVQVLDIKKNGTLSCLNFETGTKTNILKETNLFGMNFYTKIISLFSEGTNGTTQGMNPMMLMALSDEGNSDMLPMLLMSQMSGGQQQMNPMMLMALMGDKESSDGNMLEMMMMSQMFNGGNGNIFSQISQSSGEIKYSRKELNGLADGIVDGYKAMKKPELEAILTEMEII